MTFAIVLAGIGAVREILSPSTAVARAPRPAQPPQPPQPPVAARPFVPR